ncbi:ImmA/IrrE family metallo-endopeptidase [Nocardioides sp.]|uniref:ImmA/IrrE family metallo-endopeptidase n=1 Tax=Nocardioides sp. TaxID=35761 RepID=UPI002BDA6687|nr:ImmA/IrrE family metallo-endopeptidase [Nocardioides sp.]HSX65924.1 ImmA/IrrE family metallo-endopeptidase [Nocardioides sp.]
MKATRINKAACKRLAVEVRAELGLDPMQALNPWDLAELYGIRVVALGDLALDHAIRDHFHAVRPEVFSGALLPHRSGAVIVENDAHPLARRRSTMGHELAHLVAEHQFGTSLVNERGCRTADKLQEDEAAEISGELLVPSDAAKRLARQKATDDEVALRFGVSIELARWRMNATGARIIAQRAANYRRASGS